MNEVERIWTAARNRHGNFRDRRAPSPGITALLRSLAEHGPNYAGALARLSDQDQGNTVTWLGNLRRFGFVERGEEVPGLGRNGGGRPAVYWQLTGSGWVLVRALAELEHLAVA